MQLKFQQDFFLRPLRASDRREVVALIQKHQSMTVAQSVEEHFAASLEDTENYFRVILNSNGVLIGVVRVIHSKLDILAVNPNFMKKELKDTLFNELREWAMARSGGKLELASKLIVGDWKTFFKQAGAKIEFEAGAVEWLEF